jgi:UTP--glucose-1-phosphate uridylyltransferase
LIDSAGERGRNRVLDSHEARLLLRELKSYARRWKSQRDARSNAVQKAVIVAAGWQARLLPPERLHEIISHSVIEILEADIRDILVVIAPSKPTPTFEKLYKLAAEREIHPIKIRSVIQEEPLGIGHAISLCRTQIEEAELGSAQTTLGPFAVVLPVDVDRTAKGDKALKLLKDAYGLLKKPMFTVNPMGAVTEVELKHYGLAILGKKTQESESLYYVDRIEKPVQSSNRESNEQSTDQRRIIMGRYILTPEIFDVLDETPRNPRTKKYEITDALATLLKDHHFVCALDLKQTLLPLASVRALMEMLIQSITEPSVLSKMIKTTRTTLENYSRTLNVG